jgi:ketosteroid isomerase-like protein
MPADRIATVQSIYERWAEGDFGATFDLLDQDVVFVIPPEFPDAGKYLGNDAIAEYTSGFLEPWTRITIEAEELLPAGDSVVASVFQRGVGDASGARRSSATCSCGRFEARW